MELAASLSWLPGSPSSNTFSKRCQNVVAAFDAISEGVDAAFAQARGSEDLLWLRDNVLQLCSATRTLATELGPLTSLPLVYSKDVYRNDAYGKDVSNRNEVLPRVLAIAQGFFEETNDSFNKNDFTKFCLAFEETTPLEFHEIGALVPALKLVLLEQIAARGNRLVSNPENDPASKSSESVTTCIKTFRHVAQTSWKDELETLIPFDRILREDPAGAYAAMDMESRNVYREKVARIARHSDRTELEVAEEALTLARQAHEKKFSDARIGLRESHIGYYLISEGTALLWRRPPDMVAKASR
jgi:cyclic beta-1,2-glucan synthetase